MGISDPLPPSENEVLYQTLLEMSPFPISITSRADSRLMLVNTRWCQATGIRFEDAVGRTLDEIGQFFDPEDRRKILEAVDREGEIRNFQSQFRRKGISPLNYTIWAKNISFRGQACLLTQTTYSTPETDIQLALWQSDKRFQTILNNIGESYYELDLEGNFTFCNEALAVLFGQSFRELMGKTYRDFASTEDVRRLFKASEALQSGRSIIELIEYTLRRPNGTVLLVEASVSLLHDSNGQAIGFYGIVRDRTEKKRAEVAIRQSEEKHRRILEEMEEGYYEVDLEGNITYFNPAVLRMHGYAAEEIMGMNLKQYTSPKQAQELTELFNTMYQTGAPVKYHEYEIIQKDGSVRFAELSGYPSRNQAGEIVGFWGITRDRTEKKQAEIAVRQSEEKYRRILEEMDDGYYEVDLKGDLTAFNPALLQIHGYPAEEFMGMNYRKYLRPEQAQKNKQLFADIYNTGTPIQIFDYEIIRKDGSVCIAELTGYPFKDHKGEVIGFWGITRDRTEQRNAEIALRRSEEKYRKILEDMEEGYYEFDLKGNFTAFNAATCRLHGYRDDELMGMNYNQYHPPEYAGKNEQIYRQLLQTGKPVRIYDILIVHKSGLMRHIEASAYLLKNEQGKPIGFWGISRDRTEQKLAEMALKESEKQYRLLVENANDAIYITREGRIQYHNPKTSALTGYDSETLAQMPFIDLVHPDDKEATYAAQRRRLEEGQVPEVFVFRIVNQSRDILWVELSAVGMVWEGRPAALNFLRDVTHLKKTECRLQQAQKMEAIGTLAGGIAHDFNNILSAIIGYTELSVEDAYPGTKMKANLKEVLTAGHRAKELVRQILAFARQSEEKLEPITVSVIAKEVLKLIRSSVPATIEIASDIKSHAPILGNPTQVHQIIMNLCTNAAHAMENNGGVLRVELTDTRIAPPNVEALNLAEGVYLKLSVTDTGCGISPEIINSIFEPYFTTKGPGEGTGMGLSVVQGIVENYGGKITVHSQFGQGTTFNVFLPIAEKKTPVAVVENETLPLCSERVLFVDDEVVIAQLGAQILERLGYTVTFQTKSLEALRLFSTQPDAFDIVITDMTMPGMTGDRLAQELMTIRPELPVVLCTGFSNRINESSAAQMGIKALIYKPIKKSELAVTIRKILDEKNAHLKNNCRPPV